jgi:hypothetical protein
MAIAALSSTTAATRIRLDMMLSLERPVAETGPDRLRQN